MRKLRTSSKTNLYAGRHYRPATKVKNETQELRRRLAKAESELKFYRDEHEWLQKALAAQRHGRQMLEASLSASYKETVARIREKARSLIPEGAIVLVISKGDQELLDLENQRGWHFPQNQDGEYAGHYPSHSAEAIEQMQSLIAKGAEFLLLPNTAFWWLEHYGDWEEWLAKFHTPVWRDESCAIYKLSRVDPAQTSAQEIELVSPTIGSGVHPNAASAKKNLRSPEAGWHMPSLGHASRLPRERRAPRLRSGQCPQIVCFPIIDWDFRFQRPQHLMRQFANAGSRVFYLSNLFRKSGEAYVLRPLANSLWELSLQGPRFNPHQGLLDEVHCDSLTTAMSVWRDDNHAEKTVAIVQSPFWWPLVKQVAQAFAWPIVYDCMDHHAGFASSNPVLIKQERELLCHADLVIASSAILEQQARQHSRNVRLIRNGCEYERFARLCPKRPGPRPVIGYYGAIADWFDSDLVSDLAERRTDWDFILVGSTFSADLSRLSKLPNVMCAGEKPYPEIPDWLDKFDVAILPFKRTPLTEATNPVKAYEIFASGKPLVSVPLPEIVSLAQLVRLATTAEEFEREIEAELTQAHPQMECRRRRFAKANTWQQRFEQLSGAVQALLAKSNLRRLAPVDITSLPMPFA